MERTTLNQLKVFNMEKNVKSIARSVEELNNSYLTLYNVIVELTAALKIEIDLLKKAAKDQSKTGM